MVIKHLALYLYLIVPCARFEGDLSPGTEAAYNSIIWVDERPKPTWQAVVDAYHASKLNNAQQIKIKKMQAFYRAGQPLKLVNGTKSITLRLDHYEMFLTERMGLHNGGRENFIIGLHGASPASMTIYTVKLGGSFPNFFDTVVAPKIDDDWMKKCVSMGHLFAIKALPTIDEVEQYDYTQVIEHWGQTGKLTGEPLEIDISSIIIGEVQQ